MLNENLIERTVKIVVDYFESYDLPTNNSAIRKVAIKYYNATEVVNEYELAVLVIDQPPIHTVNPVLIKELKESYFPPFPIHWAFSWEP